MVPWGGFLHSGTQAKALEKEEGELLYGMLSVKHEYVLLALNGLVWFGML